MYLMRLLIRRALQHHHAGNVDALLKFYAENAKFVFPGKNSWAGVFQGKEAIAAWLRRFHRAGLKIEPHEIVAGGPPWNMTVCIRITDHAGTRMETLSIRTVPCFLASCVGARL